MWPMRRTTFIQPLGFCSIGRECTRQAAMTIQHCLTGAAPTSWFGPGPTITAAWLSFCDDLSRGVDLFITNIRACMQSKSLVFNSLFRWNARLCKGAAHKLDNGLQSCQNSF